MPVDSKVFREVVEGLPDLLMPSHLDSQAPNVLDVGNGNLGLVKVWEQPEPEPRKWFIDELIPEGVLTILHGDGGLGKSLLALILSILICLGRPFLKRKVDQQAVLYLDSELDDKEFTRRAYQIARGLGLERPPVGLHYHRLTGSITAPHVQKTIKALMEETKAKFVVLDSFTKSLCGGEDVNEVKDVTKAVSIIERWGTVIAIDHISKVIAGGNHSDSRPFGSVFKYNFSRSVIQLLKAPGGGLILRQIKNNFGSIVKPLSLSLEYGKDPKGKQFVKFKSIDIDDDQLAGIEQHLPVLDQVWRALAQHKDGATSETLAEEMDTVKKTVQNYLSILKQQSRAESSNGVWKAVLAKEKGIQEEVEWSA